MEKLTAFETPSGNCRKIKENSEKIRKILKGLPRRSVINVANRQDTKEKNVQLPMRLA